MTTSATSNANSWTYERLTAQGRSAVAVWRLHGVRPRHFAALTSLGLPIADTQLDQLRLVAIGPEPSEHCVFVPLADGTFELQTHGGSAVADRIVGLFESIDGRKHHTIRFDDECSMAVTAAKTRRVAVYLARLADGMLRKTLEEIRRLENYEQVQELRTLLAKTRSASAFLEGSNIAIVGLPNAGKSSLMNRLAGYERSLTDARPGATRDVVGLSTAFNGLPATLSDTAGMRDAQDVVEQIGIERAKSVAKSAELVLLVVDRSEPATAATERLQKDFPDALIVAHKSDLPDNSGINWPQNVIAASSSTGDGVIDLQEAIARRIEVAAPHENSVLLCSPRQQTLVQAIVNAAAKNEATDYPWDELLA